MSFNASPSFVYIGPTLLQNMRREVRRFLLHHYTRVARLVSPSNLDAWGQQPYAYAAPVSAVPCFYEIREVPVVTDEGLQTLNMPRLIIAFDDPTTVGDIVMDIHTVDNDLIFDGPAIVERIQARDPNIGGSVLNECSLRQIDFIPTAIEPT